MVSPKNKVSAIHNFEAQNETPTIVDKVKTKMTHQLRTALLSTI
jgi:hypothetical protein